MASDELILRDLVRARDACLERRRVAREHGAIRARIHALDGELGDIVDGIQRLCAQRQVASPKGEPPQSASRANSLAIAEQVLESYVRLLRDRIQVLGAAVRTGDAAGARPQALAILDHEEAIRKHCARAKLPLPPGISDRP